MGYGTVMCILNPLPGRQPPHCFPGPWGGGALLWEGVLFFPAHPWLGGAPFPHPVGRVSGGARGNPSLPQAWWAGLGSPPLAWNSMPMRVAWALVGSGPPDGMVVTAASRDSTVS